MKLILPQNTESAEPVLSVRWCLEKWEHNFLKEKRAKFIHVLFVIAYEDSNLEDRILVPIDQVAVFLNFRRPGNHTVFAKIVWTNNSSAGELKAIFLRKNNHQVYEKTVLNNSSTKFKDDFYGLWNYTIENYSEFDVSIPVEHFPKEPPEWLSKIVNWRYQYKPIDQCEFRRRLVFSPLKFAYIAVWMILTTILRGAVALILLSFGMRKINFGAIIHPWDEDFSDVFKYVKKWNSWFERDERYESRSKFLYLLHPWLYILVFVALTVFKIKLGMTYWGLISLLGTLVFHFVSRFINNTWKSILSFVVIVFLWLRILKYFHEKSKKRAQERIDFQNSDEFKKMTKAREDQSYDDLYKLLSCAKARSSDFDDLPDGRKTIRLRFLNIKSKVCRPFAAR